MTSQFSSKTTEEAGLKSQDKAESPSLPAGTSAPPTLRTKFKDCAQWVTSDNNSPVIREIVGTISCMAVITYVSGYTLGTWFHKTKKQLTAKSNDSINRTV
jgi:hypothetical protein